MLVPRRTASWVAVAPLALWTAAAQAQEAPPDAPPPPAPVAPIEAAPGVAPAPPPPPEALAPAPAVTPVTPELLVTAAPRAALPDGVVHRYRAGRVLNGLGTGLGLIGGGLSLSSIIVTRISGLSQEQVEVGPALAYAGSAATGAGVILSAAGLGLQHSALARVGADPSRGLYAGGTLLGVVGLLCVGASYFFQFTSYVDNPGTVSFALSLSGSAVLTLSGVLYLADSSRLNQVYRRLTTF